MKNVKELCPKPKTVNIFSVKFLSILKLTIPFKNVFFYKFVILRFSV